MGQLIFDFDNQPNYSPDNFLLGANNRAAYSVVDQWPEWPVPVVVLVGPSGVGKTHLLNIWQSRANALLCPVEHLQDGFNPLRYGISPTAIDDVHQIAGNAGAEKAMFHLYNLSQQNKQALLLTATAHPQHWGLLIPDLASRLRAAMVVEIAEPDEVIMRRLYQKLFLDRQLLVPPAVIDWLLLRVERSATTAVKVVVALDAAALEAQRPITIFLARKALGIEDEES